METLKNIAKKIAGDHKLWSCVLILSVIMLTVSGHIIVKERKNA
ncbi:MAG: hypothetical protein UHN88_00815 [Eubacterium sp.]|nr:hypothetical protein [Eubacterium sp.]